MGLVALIYGKCWIQSIEYNNPISFILFSTINIMYLYLTANNQLFVQRGSSIATIILLIIWWTKSNKYNSPKNNE
jgi:Ca2+/Na+ antiporter